MKYYILFYLTELSNIKRKTRMAQEINVADIRMIINIMNDFIEMLIK